MKHLIPDIHAKGLVLQLRELGDAGVIKQMVCLQVPLAHTDVKTGRNTIKNKHHP
ncbi:hypothetical protein [Bacillus haynesii]|uniref:hypothetical protein n=1 Tax=Bacillus haynesii TaxID=1925021 RepID=UPI0004B1273F|nr:hypothetical protein [Bacillus haynesii]MCI4126828.1 winged helix-turn-helix transcriptional regulator [Bacillus haynesii]